ncbi:MAG: FtsX-like permease family protein, partial [Pseudomonadota bacterium]
AGPRERVEAFELWVTPRLARGESLQSLSNARPEIRATLERAQKFIGLTSLLAVVLAAVAISLGARRYTQRHLDGCAVMRCAGASQRQLLGLFAGEFAALGVLAGAAGCIAGYLAQYAIAWLVAELVAVPLPQPTLLPALQGFLIGFVLLLGFALPPLLQLKHVPALRVIRRDLGPPRERALAAYGAGLTVMAALLVWQAGEARLGLIVLGGFGAAFVVFGGIAFGALHVLGGATRVAGLTWRYGLANLRRRAATNTVQVLALALGLTAILLLSFTRGDLLATWKAKIPTDAPNRFIVNIQPEQRALMLEFFRDHGIALPQTYPMVRGRYVALNGAPVEAQRFDAREQRLIEREFNLSYMDAMPGHNRIVAGRGFSQDDLVQGALSVEEGIARSLGWKLGDRLSWQVAGETFSAPIVNVRKLDWDSMRVNFFVIATPGLLAGAATSYITSFHLPQAQAQFTNRLSQRFPNMTVVDMSAILRQAQSVLEQVIRAVQLVFLFAVGAGILVLYSALLATRDERVQ